MKDLSRDIRYLNDTCDLMAQAAFNISQTNDWVAQAALVTLEGMLDDLGERVEELRGIKFAMEKLQKEREDGVR